MKKQFLVSGLSVLMLSALPAAAATGSVPTLTPSSASGHSAVLTGKPIGPGCSALPSSGKGSPAARPGSGSPPWWPTPLICPP